MIPKKKSGVIVLSFVALFFSSIVFFNSDAYHLITGAATPTGMPAIQLNYFLPTNTPTPTPTPKPGPAAPRPVDPPPKSTDPNDEPLPPNSACEGVKSLWNRTYGWGGRVRLITECVVIRGRVFTEFISKNDGDIHIKMTVEKPYRWMVGGQERLVAEIVCWEPGGRNWGRNTCANFDNPIKFRPSVGDHIEVYGSFVRDSHGNREIHPISSIKKLN